MIQDQSESNSERGKDRNCYLSEEAGLTLLLGKIQSFEDCDWLVFQEGNKRVLLRVGFIYKPSLRNNRRNFTCFTVHSLSLTHTLYMYIYILYFLFTML